MSVAERERPITLLFANKFLLFEKTKKRESFRKGGEGHGGGATNAPKPLHRHPDHPE